MRRKPSLFRNDSDRPAHAASVPGFEPFANHLAKKNTLEDVIGEAGLVLVVFLGIAVAVSAAVSAFGAS